MRASIGPRDGLALPSAPRVVAAAPSARVPNRPHPGLREGNQGVASIRSQRSALAGVALLEGNLIVALTIGTAIRWRRRRRMRKRSGRHVSLKATAQRPYDVVPHEGCGFGASIHGFDMRSVLGDPDITAMLRSDMAKHRLLVFHGQTEFTAEDHLALSEQLGSLDHGLHKPHPKAPDPRLLRVANDRKEGFIQVGTSGWHVDGVMLRTPFTAQTMHFLSALEGGDTLFLGLNELLGSLEPDFEAICRRLWFVSGVGEDLAAGDGQVSLLPLVYQHPVTGKDTMCFHLGQSYCLGWIEEKPPADGLGGVFEGWGRLMAKDDAAGPDSDLQRALRKLLAGADGSAPDRFNFLPPEPAQQAIQAAIDALDGEARKAAVWRQQWQTGDLALIDNLALAHLPTPGTQSFMGGLRLFHRTTMVDRNAVPRTSRGATAVLLAGGNYAGDKKPSAKGAYDAPKAMRYIISALNAVTPVGERGGEQRVKKEAPAREEAIRSLQEGGHSLALLDEVDEKVKAARLGGKDAVTKVLKSLMLELHPDRNQGKEEIVPVFKYLRHLRTEQGRSSVPSSVKERLKQKAKRKQPQPSTS